MPMSLKPPQRLRNLPLNTLAPNILTIIALCSGLTAIRFALLGQFKFAVMAIAIAALALGALARAAGQGARTAAEVADRQQAAMVARAVVSMG
ncbi:MAG: hypothetical protein ACK4GK_15130, partial [Ferrovibrio sp.]